MNYNEHNQTNEFLDSLASNSFIPLILQPNRITSHSNSLIDNIFSNVIDPDIISGNLTATISDHLPQFSIIPNMFGNIPGNKSNIYERDWSKFDRENFILDYFSVEWEDLLKIDELNADKSTKKFLDKINMLLDTYAPLKRVKKLSTLMKKSKQAYYKRYFEKNWNNIKNIWKEMKSFISLKTVASIIPTVTSLDNDDTIINSYDITNTFNNYFASIGETTNRSIKF